MTGNLYVASSLVRGMNLPWIASFCFTDTATSEIYTLSLHDALPIYNEGGPMSYVDGFVLPVPAKKLRSEEHTSELQSQSNLVCRLLLEKKNGTPPQSYSSPAVFGSLTRPLYQPPPPAWTTSLTWIAT